MSEKGL